MNCVSPILNKKEIFMKSRFAFFVFIIACLGHLSGCATVFSKSKYPVTINSSPSDARITIVDKSGGTVFTGRTPNTVILKAGSITPAHYSITFEAEGYEKSTFSLKSGFDKWVIGNILFGPSVVLTVAIDAVTGSMYTLPETVSMSLIPVSPPISSTDGKSIHIISLNDVPVHLRPHLIRIDK